MNPKVYLEKAKKLNVMKLIVMLVMLSTCMIQVFIIYLQKWRPETLQNHLTLFKIIIYTIKLLKVLADVYMYQLFVRQIKYFIEKKKKLNMEENDLEEPALTPLMRFVVFFTMIIFLLCMFQTLIVIAQTIIE
jgi:hypothetical protein